MKQYSICFLNSDYTIFVSTSHNIIASSACNAVENYVDGHRIPACKYAKVCCENGLEFLFEID